MVKLGYVIIFYFFTFIIISTIVCAIAQEGEIMKVRYNGNKEYGYACGGIAELLVPGDEYDVKYIRVNPSSTELVLDGLNTNGTRFEDLELSDYERMFNSVWFDEVSDDDGNYMVYTSRRLNPVDGKFMSGVPVVGEPMHCYKLELNSDEYFIPTTTAPVKEVFRVPKALANIYHVITADGCSYMVDVHK